MDFQAGGRLVYTIRLAEGDVTVVLRYEVRGSVLHTDNPDAPNPVAVPIGRGPADTLVIEFPGSPAVFVREAGAVIG